MFRSVLHLSIQPSAKGLAKRIQPVLSRSLAKLQSLTTDQLCHLLDHAGLSEFAPYIHVKRITGLDFDAKTKDLAAIQTLGFSDLPAKTLFSAISKWKDDDLPAVQPTPVKPPYTQDRSAEFTMSAYTTYQQCMRTYEYYRVAYDHYTNESKTKMLVHEADLGSFAAQLFVNVIRNGSRATFVNGGLYSGLNRTFPYGDKPYIVDVQDALRTVQKVAEQNDPFAQLVIALCCRNGIVGLEQNTNKFLRLLRLAADQGLSCAQYELAKHYLIYMEDCTAYKQVAFEYYTRAARQGDVQAQFGLGYCYEDGLGTEQDSEQAFLYYKVAADFGYVAALRKVAECYEYGYGVRQDRKKAKEYLHRAKLLDTEMKRVPVT